LSAPLARTGSIPVARVLSQSPN